MIVSQSRDSAQSNWVQRHRLGTADKPSHYGCLILLQRHSLIIVGIPSPRHPHFTYFKAAKILIEPTYVVLVCVSGDDNSQLPACHSRYVVDDLV